MAYSRVYYAENAETMKQQHAAYHAANPGATQARVRKRRALLKGGGTHTAADVRAQYERQNGRCYYCGEKVGDTYHVDHVMPVILGGSNGPENLVIACEFCNKSKGAKHPMEFAGVML